MAETPIRIVYFGTAPFAVPPLRSLLADPVRFDVVAVVSQPDRPGDRGRLTRPPVAIAADEAGVPVLQPSSLKDDATVDRLRALDADLFVVAAYGLIVPQRVLDLPRLGALNFHGSLLPAYRGASPIHAALLDGLKETGVTLMKMDAKMDHGTVLATVRVPVAPDDDHASLEAKLADAAAKELVPKIVDHAEGRLTETPQDHEAATFTSRITKADGRIDWMGNDAGRIERMVRAYRTWPGAFTEWCGEDGRTRRLKITEARVLPEGNLPAGAVGGDENGVPVVGTKNGDLALLRVVPEGKGEMDGAAFLRGHAEIGAFLIGKGGNEVAA